MKERDAYEKTIFSHVCGFVREKNRYCRRRKGRCKDKADIVLAATDDAALNEEVARCCRKRGILVNTSHKKELCDFYFPAVAIQGNVVAGITASGQDHAKARKAAGQIRLALKDLEKEDISTNE